MKPSQLRPLLQYAAIAALLAVVQSASAESSVASEMDKINAGIRARAETSKGKPPEVFRVYVPPTDFAAIDRANEAIRQSKADDAAKFPARSDASQPCDYRAQSVAESNLTRAQMGQGGSYGNHSPRAERAAQRTVDQCQPGYDGSIKAAEDNAADAAADARRTKMLQQARQRAQLDEINRKLDNIDRDLR